MKEKEYQTCESCKYFEKNDCKNEKVENLLFTHKNFGCVFWVVNPKGFYANGIRLREEGMNPAQAEAVLNKRRDPAPSPVRKIRAKTPPRLKIYQEPQDK